MHLSFPNPSVWLTDGTEGLREGRRRGILFEVAGLELLQWGEGLVSGAQEKREPFSFLLSVTAIL